MESPLRRLRLSRGLSLRDVANAVGADDSSISRIETGKQKPSPELAQRIVEYFGSRRLTELHILYPERYRDEDCVI